jgi:hypothetical protein
MNTDHAPESAHDRIMRIIRARCGDVLTERDVASLADAQPDPTTGCRPKSRIGFSMFSRCSKPG